MPKRSYLAGLLLVLLVASCATQQAEYDEGAPAIDILAPREMDVVQPGDTMLVKIRITENLELHTYSIFLHHPDSRSVLTLKEEHTHSREVHYEKGVLVPPIPDAQFEIVVRADDHDANEAEARRVFQTSPL